MNIRKLRLFPQEYQPSAADDTEERRIIFLWAAAGVVILVVLNLARSWQTLKMPGLFMEDSLLFSYYFGHSQKLSAIFSSHVGQNYLTVPADFFAWLFSWLDVRVQPYAYQWLGWCGAVAAASCIFFSGLVRSRVVLLLGPSVLGLIGLNHIYYYNTLIYTMYTGVLVLFCLLLYPPPRTWCGTVLMAFLFIVLPWSGPYSVLMLPAGALHLLLVRNRRKTIMVLMSICSTVLYFSTVTSHTANLRQLKYWVAKRYCQVLVEKIFFLHMFHKVALYWGVVTLLLVILSWFLFRRDRQYAKNVLLIFLLIFSSLALFFLSVKFPMYLKTSNCHRVIAVFFWLFFLLYVFDRICLLYRPQKFAVSIFVVFFIVIIVSGNLKYPKYGWVKPVVGVNEFVAALSFYNQANLGAENEYIVLFLPSHQWMHPEVRIGSRRKDARLVRLDQMHNPAWRKFYKVEKKKQARK